MVIDYERIEERNVIDLVEESEENNIGLQKIQATAATEDKGKIFQYPMNTVVGWLLYC